MKLYKNRIFNISSEKEFNNLCLDIFKYQARNNYVYKDYINYLGVKIDNIDNINNIPFLPIDFFKTHKIITGNNTPRITFTSSGTTGQFVSKHFVADLSIYEKSFLKTFELFYGNIENFCILALLPSYLERKGSSLIYMTDILINKTKNSDSGFYLNNTVDLYKKLSELEKKGKKVLLLGVSFALLDFFGKYNIELKNTIIMETGGMKGKGKELVKEELHKIICNATGVKTIHSEYGMTELLSQAYSTGDNLFKTPPYLKVLIRDVNDPFDFLGENKTGGINIIDLANINSCSFIETKDLGKKYNDGSFEVLGRFDNSDIRGCNLLVI